MLVQRTERGDEMFLVTLARYAQQVLDLDAIELLPEPGSGRPPALRPEPEDEAPHVARLGGAVERELVLRRRLRRRARRRVHAPRPVPEPRRLVDDDVRVRPGQADARADRLRRAAAPGRAAVAELRAAAGRAHLHRAAGELRGAPAGQPRRASRTQRRSCAASTATPVELALALRWDTTGEPYAYRATTRYEIPCRVSGTVRCGEETIEFAGVGQRDHSWGVRDWWSAEWMWSAAHLQDGTHLHGVEFRLPGAPPVGDRLLPAPGGRSARARRRARAGAAHGRRA